MRALLVVLSLALAGCSAGATSTAAPQSSVRPTMPPTASPTPSSAGPTSDPQLATAATHALRTIAGLKQQVDAFLADSAASNVSGEHSDLTVIVGLLEREQTWFDGLPAGVSENSVFALYGLRLAEALTRNQTTLDEFYTAQGQGAAGAAGVSLVAVLNMRPEMVGLAP